MRKLVIILYFLCIINIHSTLFSQDNTNVSEIELTEELTNTNTGNSFLEQYYATNDTNITVEQTTESPAITFIRILLITGILAFLTWIILRFFFRRNALALSSDGKSIEVLATIPAGLGAYFLIAKLNNLYYLFSLSTDGLRLLDKITDQEAIDFIELNKADTIPQDIKFVDLLEHLPEGRPKKALEFLRDKISDLKKK